MKVQEYIIDATRDAVDMAFRYAAAVPADKLEWKPLDQGRSVLDQAKEMAMCPLWAVQIISEPGPPKFDDERMQQQRVMMEQWTTLEQCKAECEKNLEKLNAFYRTITEEMFSQTKWLPFNGGRDHTVLEMMDYPRWNCTYHLGQIAYVQSLYGDKNMY